MDLFNELKARNIFSASTNDQEIQKAFSNKCFFYLGIDPTSDSLHLGHYQNINLIKILLKHNLKPIIVLGGATGLIGDPSGKSNERTLIDRDTLNENVKKIKKQITSLLGDKIVIENNYDWYKKMDVFTFLIELGKRININYMLSKESIKTRLQSGISYTEFSYLLLQAYDFYYLYKKYNSENKHYFIQIGGSDQWGNITTGLELIRKNHGLDNKALGFTTNLLLDESGNKFGKSEGKPIWLDMKKTNNYELFQFIFNLNDNVIFDLLKRLTDIPLKEIESIENQHNENKAKRIAQRELAKFLIKNLHSIHDYHEAEDISKNLFANDFSSLSETMIKRVIDAIGGSNIKNETTIINAIEKIEFINSRRELREHINAKALSINNKVIETENDLLSKDKALYNKYFIVSIGKKKRAILIIE